MEMWIEGLFRRRRLPHWDVADATYFVTCCLADSIPARGLLDIQRYRDELNARTRPREMDEDAWEEHKHKLVFGRLEWHLDHEPAARWLEKPIIAVKVVESIYHFAEERYHLLAFVVMPSHIHWLFKPTQTWCDTVANDRRRTPRERILHSLKSFTAHECNAILGRSGRFWQDESYEHCVRSEDELLRIIEYIERNPVKAGLCREPSEWRFSSAYDRRELGIGAGEVLVRQMVPPPY